MKFIKNISAVMIFQLLSIGLVQAYCNFEIVGMGTSVDQLNSKIANLNISITTNEPSETKFSAARICSDPEFENITLIYEYIDRKLARIQFNDYNPSVDHLRNIIYHYGEPVVSNEVLFGIRYYHWDLTFRDAFLNVEIDQEGNISQTSLVITSNDYASALRKYQSYD